MWITPSRPAACEVLERRVLWSGAPGEAVLANGLLSIAGTEGNDVVAVSVSEGRVHCLVNGAASSYDAGQVTGVVVEAGAGDDTLTMDASVGVPVTLLGGDGNDSLVGGSAGDYLCGNAGRDTLRGGIGDDTLCGGREGDELHGGQSDDYLIGARGNDSLYGMTGNDTLLGREGDDFLAGSPGDDSMEGNAGNDTLFDGVGADTFRGGQGDDQLKSWDGGETGIFYGGLGDDLATFGNWPWDKAIPQHTDIERVIVGSPQGTASASPLSLLTQNATIDSEIT